MLGAYLITFGLPYAFLMWSARRAAVLNPPDDEIAYLVTPFVIDRNGKLSIPGSESEESGMFASHRDLTRFPISPRSKSISISDAEIEVIPPKWNPFVQTVTQISLPGHHLLSTVGSGELHEDTAKFSQSLANEALLYFSTAENLVPVEISKESRESATEDLLSASNYETAIVRELAAPQGEITGKIILVLPSYGNKRKSLEALVKKLKDSCESVNFKEVIPSLRQEILKARLEEIAANPVKVEIQEESQPDLHGTIEEDDDSTFWGGSKSGGIGLLDGIDDDDFPTSGKGSKK
jgi:hypothetical protein